MADRTVGNALRNALSGTRDGVSHPCPDDNLLAAYLDGLLSAGEKSDFEEHVSRCQSCRQVLGLALTLPGGDSMAQVKSAHTSVRPALWWLRSPLAATAAAALVVIVGAVLFTIAPGSRAPAPQVSSFQVPQEKAKASQPARPLASEPAAPDHAAAEPKGRRARRDASDAVRRPEPQEPAVAAPPPPPAAAPEAQTAALGVATSTREAKSEVGATAPPLQAENEPHPAERSRLNQAAYADRQDEGAAQSPAQALKTLAERGFSGSEERSLGDLRFYRVGDYWIDGRCADRAGRRIVEIAPGSLELRDITTALPGLRELLQDGMRVIVLHSGDICLLPPQP